MPIFVDKSQGFGNVCIPSSKSHTLRALVFALMADGKSTIHNYLPSPDTEAMLLAIEQLGARIIVRTSSRLEIEGVAGRLQPPSNVIDAGNSGIVLRFIGALAALLPTYTVVTGDLSIRTRRVASPLLEGLRGLGAFAESCRCDGYAPILIKGPIQGGTATLSGEDSQPVSSLLIACSFLSSPSKLYVRNPGEKPWIEMTLHWMQKLGLAVSHHNFSEYLISGKGKYPGFTVSIPGDISSAAFPIAAALITQSELFLQNIDLSDVQGDKKLIDIFMQMGAHIEINPKEQTLFVKKTNSLQGIEADLNDCIDALPVLSALACYANTPTKIKNASIARKKESDRIQAIASELRKMGASILEHQDGLTIFPASLTGATVHSHFDHRIAMALAIAGFGAQGATCVEETVCIQKTYPDFVKSLQQVGFSIKGS